MVIAGHSRSKNGVASLAYGPGNPSIFKRRWMRGSSPRMTSECNEKAPAFGRGFDSSSIRDHA
jgi:hypothetical protein